MDAVRLVSLKINILPFYKIRFALCALRFAIRLFANYFTPSPPYLQTDPLFCRNDPGNPAIV